MGTYDYRQLTLGQLWDSSIQKHENKVREVLNQVQGEQIIERTINTLKDYWSLCEIETYRYQNKTKIIKGWNELFARCEEDTQNLETLKISQYYKFFEEEILQWTQKLQLIKTVFEIWSDVQRKWVYLEGIFNGPSEIKSQLPEEYQRFQSIDNEFQQLMKIIVQKPRILEILQNNSLQKTLDRLSSSLSKIQKSLSEYLEIQRQSYARFYFVGDQDLLEMIGNSKNIKLVMKYFSKMYAGVESVEGDEKQEKVRNLVSKQGEVVPLHKEVEVTGGVDKWLKELDNNMMVSLAQTLFKTFKALQDGDLMEIINYSAAQIVILALQIDYCFKIEQNIPKNQVKHVEQYVLGVLAQLTLNIVGDLNVTQRQKIEQVITDFVHHRDVTRQLFKVQNVNDFGWKYFMRFYCNPQEIQIQKQCIMEMAGVTRNYGFEYLGIGERLVQTPLTDKCFVTLTQALNMRLGGSPFGPAGTGKTESVKALGGQLGQFVLTFNCDETFDLNAMGRIFIGVCQVGAWGCFDEFNRLEERVLSAVSQQILLIQQGLIERVKKIDLMGKDVYIQFSLGIFITMNPGYAGRSALPENLKQLFRQMAMTKPDSELIAQVTLYSQGYQTAEKLSGKIVYLFDLCKDQLSSQPHYDFGLRALKCVLCSAGNLKRSLPQGEVSIEEFEQNILLLSVINTIFPKLVQDDIPLINSLFQSVFPGCKLDSGQDSALTAIKKVCQQRMLLPEKYFIEKIFQLKSILELQHGIMLVGPSGQGKTQAWNVLLEALQMIDKVKGESYIIDPKAIHKDYLYGRMDPYTFEWKDGIFTSILRMILENQKGESSKRHWIIFDGDVDPEWAENLNSVLDDNKLLTLPNGERLSIPKNVKILFEVETLKYATLATVSRCGMVWFADYIINNNMIFHHYLKRLQKDNYDDLQSDEEQITPEITLRRRCLGYIDQYFVPGNNVVCQSLELAKTYPHVMTFTIIRVLESFFSLIRKALNIIIEHQQQNNDFPIQETVIRSYMINFVLVAMCWSFGGSISLVKREEFSRQVLELVKKNGITILKQGCPIDWEILIETGQLQDWQNRVQRVELDIAKLTDSDLIITTVDTLRHQFVLGAWLSEHRAFLICGPPGSGKTMTLMSTLKSLPSCEMVFINFSSTTKPDMLLLQFNHYCEYVKTTKGVFLKPKNPSKWLIIFCDEINLPETDKYGTVVVITFLRQIAEQKGFWRNDNVWIQIDRITFVGACNPPTDVGRSLLSDRFLRHVPLILVDYPGRQSFVQIYGTFNRAMLKKAPNVKNYADALTEAQVDVYLANSNRFTAEIQPHYIYSPRELSRWKVAINEAIESIEDLDGLVRLWAHEGLRLFHDRLIYDDEKQWCNDLIDQVAYKYFPQISKNTLQRPIYFSTYLKTTYSSVSAEDLKKHIEARLKTFYEEVLAIPIVVFSSVLDHIIRIDRVLRQPLGHCLLVGKSGVGKTTLSRFVSWMNNLSVFQIKAGRNYGLDQFDQDLREVMKRAGCKGEKISFIFDESNILSVAFMERMNALLASGEIPGLFENDEYHLMISQMRENYKHSTSMDDDQLYKAFIHQVQRNLHVVFTMNPAGEDFTDRGASSPALYNRCVIDWFGDWPDQALYQVSKEYTMQIDPMEEQFTNTMLPDARQESIVECIVQTHKSVDALNIKLQKAGKKFNYLTPRDFIDYIKHFQNLYFQKRSQLEEQHLHLNQGLQKLEETAEIVQVLQDKLDIKKAELTLKENEANQKLLLMMKQQQQTEQKKEETLTLKNQMIIKQQDAEQNQKQVENQLSSVIPILEKSKEQLKNIDKKELNELQKYANPTPLVKLVVNGIICFVKNKSENLEWATVRTEFNKPGILNQILSFDGATVTKKTMEFIKKNFISHEDWNIDKIFKASSVCGPMANWLDSQIKFTEISINIEPLKNKLASLIAECSSLKENLGQKESLLVELETQLAKYQVEYAQLISQIQYLKQEMNQILTKVTRSESLLNNLSSERIRWSQQCQQFKTHISSLLGDTLISASFLAYIGFFDFFYRRQLQNEWNQIIQHNNISIRDDLNQVQYLSASQDQIEWQAHKLPEDELCYENAILLKRFNRYPLVIDPSGQAIDFLQSYYANDKLICSSFRDPNFLKSLEKSIRFGCPLLIQDVDKLEPILTNILNKEIYKKGGRLLILIGDQEIDFSKNFNLFMITRDSNCRFPPNVCSRVTFINFTVTYSSLQNQCLNIYLKSERPDIQEKRTKQLKIQGEFAVKLRFLEDNLLEQLSNSTGNILENEKLLNTLENIKKESKEVLEAMGESEQVMSLIKTVTNEYVDIAEKSSKLYFAMQ